MNNKLKNFMVKLLIIALFSLAPGASLANSLQYHNSATTSPDTSNDVILECPAEVRAGEDFSILLVAGKNFPLLFNQEAAFYESFAGEPFKFIKALGLDKRGKAKLMLKNFTAGDYRYQIRMGSYKKEIQVTVLPGKPVQIKGESGDLFFEVGNPAGVGFRVEDSYGNSIGAGNKPGQRLPGDLLQVSVADQGLNEISTGLSSGPSPDGNFLVSFNAEKIGDYLVRVLLKGSDVFAETIVRVREFGEVSGIRLTTTTFDSSEGNREEDGRKEGGNDGGESFLRISGHGGKHNAIEYEALLVGQHGFQRAPLSDEEINIFFSTNRPDLLLVENIGRGRVLVTEKGKPGLATVTATFLVGKKGLQDNIDVWIGGSPAQINLKTSIKGLTAWAEATLLDKNAEPTFEDIGNYELIIPMELRVVSKTAFAKGKASFMLEAEKYGNYASTLINGNISNKFHLLFEKSIGAESAEHVVIFIGQKSYFKDGVPNELSHAPWISYGHVFVPVDFLADILAAETLTFPPAKKIGLRKKNTEVIIDRNSSTLFITEKGATKTQPIGPLFLQEKDSTYFVPAITIASLFGAKVDHFPKSGPIEHISFTLK